MRNVWLENLCLDVRDVTESHRCSDDRVFPFISLRRYCSSEELRILCVMKIIL